MGAGPCAARGSRSGAAHSSAAWQRECVCCRCRCAVLCVRCVRQCMFMFGVCDGSGGVGCSHSGRAFDGRADSLRPLRALFPGRRVGRWRPRDARRRQRTRDDHAQWRGHSGDTLHCAVYCTALRCDRTRPSQSPTNASSLRRTAQTGGGGTSTALIRTATARVVCGPSHPACQRKQISRRRLQQVASTRRVE